MPAVDLARELGAGDLAHGVVEGEAEDLDKEVDGVAGQVALGPAPVTVFDQEALVGGQLEVTGVDGVEPYQGPFYTQVDN